MDDNKKKDSPARVPKPKTPKIETPKIKRVDLGLIIVVSKGTRDIVFLAHNHLKVFSLNCPPDTASRLHISRKFYAYEETQWDEVFRVYIKWKREVSPDFKLPRHSGRRLDGHHHPWRWHKPGGGRDKK